MHTVAPRLDVLPDEQRRLWPKLRPAAQLGFVLYGGTAVALRLGHRRSVDFDFFTERRLSRFSLRQRLSFLGESSVIQDRPDTLTVLVPAGAGAFVKVSFFGGIDFGRIEEPELTNDGVLQVASADDLMALKLKVLCQRVESKDYQDIAAMIAAGASLERGLAGASLFFGASFAITEALKALVHFKGGDLDQVRTSDRDLLIRAAASVRSIPPISRSSWTLSGSSPPAV